MEYPGHTIIAAHMYPFVVTSQLINPFKRILQAVSVSKIVAFPVCKKSHSEEKFKIHILVGSTPILTRVCRTGCPV